MLRALTPRGSRGTIRWPGLPRPAPTHRSGREVGQGPLERGRRPDRDRVRDRPVGVPGLHLAVGRVAHRDDHVVAGQDLGRRGGPVGQQPQPVPRATRTVPGWIRAAGRVPAEATGRPVRLAHSGGRQLRAGGVARAHEHDPPRRQRGDREPAQRRQGFGHQAHVGPPAVGLRGQPAHQPRRLQHLQVVGQQVRRHPQRGGEVPRADVAHLKGSTTCSRPTSDSAA